MDQLAKCLEATINPNNDIRKPAEKYLLELEKNPGFGEGLFMIIMNNYSMEIKVASAITFKNFVKRNWKIDESNDDNISKLDRDFIKSNIVELMLNNSPMIENQLSESVSIIGKNDFPDNWTSLLPQLIGKLKERNFIIINGVLRTFNSLFKRYRFESRSDDLWLEIKEVIRQLGTPLIELIQQTMALIDQNSSDKSALLILWNSVLLIGKIFLSLNHQDLPEFFEDSMALWMDQFHRILSVSNPMLDSGDSDEIGILEQVKSTICDIISLYARNYDEEFTNYLSVFIDDILQLLLLSTDSQPKFDNLVSNSLRFLSLIADRTHHRELFVSKINLELLLQRIIIPNIEFQESDGELFLENPDEYIRRDIEGSHSETRRKSACELVKSLCRLFQQQIIDHFIEYIRQLLDRYRENPDQNWKSKDSALFLITTVASKTETNRFGVTSTTEFVDIQQFYRSHIVPELENSIGSNPVVKADSIKYLMTFRSIISPEEIRTGVNLLINFSTNPLHVVHSYASAAINKLLMVKDVSTRLPVISASHIRNPTTFVSSLCAALSIPGSEDNCHVMQSIMRSLSVLQDKSLDCMNYLVEFLRKKLALVVKNPRKPLFNHSLIETIAICIKIVCVKDRSFVTSFESVLCPIFNTVLCDDCEDFVPYAFQLFSLMLDQYPVNQVTKPYQELFPFLIHPALWERPGNIPSLIRLLLSYLEKSDWSIIADKLSGLISIFQKLNKSRALDSFGFSLVSAILLYVPRQHAQSYLRQIFESVFQRLTQNKTAKYLREFLVFLAGLVLIYEPDEVIDMIDKIQANLFQMTIESVVLPSLARVEAKVEKRICLGGLTRLAMESQAMTVGGYSRFWPVMVTKIVESLSTVTAPGNEENEVIDSEMHFVDIEATSYATSHNQLVFVGKKTVDPSGNLGDVRVYFGSQLKRFSAADPQRFGALFNSLEAGVVSVLKGTLGNVGVHI